jgi:hypothetical protein
MKICPTNKDGVLFKKKFWLVSKATKIGGLLVKGREVQ